LAFIVTSLKSDCRQLSMSTNMCDADTHSKVFQGAVFSPMDLVRHRTKVHGPLHNIRVAGYTCYINWMQKKCIVILPENTML